MADAETGSRGYVLTGDTAYLGPYRTASASLAANLAMLRELAESPGQRAQLAALEPLIDRRLAIVRRTIELRREQGFPAALAIIQTGRGKAVMDSVRHAIDVLAASEQQLLQVRSRSELQWMRRATVAIGAALLVALTISLVAAVVVRRDLAVRVAAEGVLREARDVAEAASRAKSEFLASMSHELRTPLNSVIGFSNLLLRRKGEALGADGRLYLERVRDNGMHLLHLIDDLLDLARIEAGRLRVERRPVDVADLVRTVVGSLDEDARQRGLALVSDLPPAPVVVEADPTRLRQVLVNLVGNALKFTEQGSVVVRVVVGRRAGGSIRLDVVDTGIGIAPDRVAAVFEPFEQADTGTARRYGGTGLGLAISRSMCELMGCRLEVVSTVGVGSTFSVAFPPQAGHSG
jgi:signal transduction histidine kinase